MQFVQWTVAAGTAIFVALVGFFQWRTAQQKAALDLFERRHAIYEVVRKAVGQMVASSTAFDRAKEIEFLDASERAYFFFGDDVATYLTQLWKDIVEVRTMDDELRAATDPDTLRKQVERRQKALARIARFDTAGLLLFARYMRFSQAVR